MPQSFLHITDIHFWEIVRNPMKMLNKRLLGNANVALRRRRHFLQDRAHSYLDVLAATGVKTALLGGDFSSTATEGEFKRAAEWILSLSKEMDDVALVLGNHDVYTFESARKQLCSKHLEAFLPQKGYPSSQVLKNGVSLVMAHSVCPNLLSSRGLISDTEIAQTVELVRACPPGPVVLMAHYPCLHKTYAYNSTWSRQLRNAEAFRTALGGTGRKLLYLAGHVHRFSYVQDPIYPQMSHLCTPAFFLHRPESGVSGAFSEVHVNGDNFEVYLHEHSAAWQRARQAIRSLEGAPLEM